MWSGVNGEVACLWCLTRVRHVSDTLALWFPMRGRIGKVMTCIAFSGGAGNFMRKE